MTKSSSATVTASGKGSSLQRGSGARKTFNGKDARRQVQNVYNGPNCVTPPPPHTGDMLLSNVGRPSFFNRLTQKFSRRWVDVFDEYRDTYRLWFGSSSCAVCWIFYFHFLISLQLFFIGCGVIIEQSRVLDICGLAALFFVRQTDTTVSYPVVSQKLRVARFTSTL